MKIIDDNLMNGLAKDAQKSPKPTKDIYLAGGCFWGTEHYFKQIEGVAITEVGFANGHTENPTYKEVYTDTTGFAETVFVRFYPDVVSLEFLLRMFFKAIDPTSLNKQGHDEGTRYRTGVYYTDPADLPVIEKVFAEEQKNYEQPLVVEKRPLQNFYTAEEYHQDYLDKNPDGYCHLPQSLFEFARKAKEEVKLWLLFLICFLSSCGHHGQTASKEGEMVLSDTIEWIVEELSKEIEFDADESIGFAGERTHQYGLSDSLWHVATTEQLAYLALSHPSPVVRLSASYGLMEREPHIAAEIAIEGVSDTAMLEVIKGCIGECRTVSEDRIRELSVNRRWYGLSVEDSLRLDSLVLYKPYHDRYDRELLEDYMIRMSPRPEYYERVKELFQKEHCIYALIGIAKYQRADDKTLMTDMAQKAIRLAQEKEDKEIATMESDGKEETLEVIEVEEEEEDELEFRCTPPQEPSEGNAGCVSYVVFRCASFWPDIELLRAVQPLRHYYPHLFDSFHIGIQREDSK